MSEVWRDIKDFKGYQVSDSGRVRSLDRDIRDKRGQKRNLKGRTLASFVRVEDGVISRRMVTLCNEKGQRAVEIQELVIEAFLEPATLDQVICFGENGPNDASVSNLEYRYIGSGEPC